MFYVGPKWGQRTWVNEGVFYAAEDLSRFFIPLPGQSFFPSPARNGRLTFCNALECTSRSCTVFSALLPTCVAWSFVFPLSTQGYREFYLELLTPGSWICHVSQGNRGWSRCNYDPVCVCSKKQRAFREISGTFSSPLADTVSLIGLRSPVVVNNSRRN